jgi:radical SAM superfamily enzyme YgiQ (UPF0313 family)
MDEFELIQMVGEQDHPVVDTSRGAKPLSVCLITALTVTDFIDPELTTGAIMNTGAQLGILTLTAILQEKGFKTHVVDLDNLFLAYLEAGKNQPVTEAGEGGDPVPVMTEGCDEAPQLGRLGSFFAYAAEHLKPLSFDAFGFSSICSSYPLTLRLAQEVRRSNMDAWILLGGPQASVVDVATMRAFPCVDFVVRGEADDTFPALLGLLSRPAAGGWEGIPGITFRSGDDVIRNPNAPAVRDLDRLPLPAFDVDPKIRERDGIHLEIGRGCPFACTFCSTNDFFRRNFRLKSTWKTIEEMRWIKQQYGFDYFSFVHDMYTIDRKKVVEFCQALLELGERFTWGCSARTDCIDDELIALMAGAGCNGIFFGIETGSDRMQRVIHKKLDLAEARKRIQCADRHGVDMAVAFIIGFPEETRDDLRDTIHFFIDSLRYDHAQPQISLLAPLAATPIYHHYKEQLVFDHIFSDMSHQGWRQDPAELEMIQTYPDIFPNFYAVPLTWLDRGYLRELEDFVTYLATWFRWLPIALLQDRGDFLEVFDRWRRWLTERSASEADEDGADEEIMSRAPYYSQRRFWKEFAEFVRTCYLKEMATAQTAIEILCRTEGLSYSAAPKCSSRSITETDCWTEGCVPYQPENLHILELEIDYKELIECLRNRGDLSRVPQRRSTIVYRPIGEKLVQVWQLAPLSATLLRLCDGKRAVRDIIREFSLLETDVDEIPVEKVGFFSLMRLREEGFIGLSTGPVVGEDSDPDEGTTAMQPLCPLTPQTAGTQQPWPPRLVIPGKQ